jgi:general L-amino acid transport system substrate-binding protein
MKKFIVLATLAVAGIAAGMSQASTLDEVKARGSLNCGVTTGLTGFAEPNASGVWEGFDVAVCRAVAAAVFGDPMAVEFVPTTGQTRFTALASGEVDMLARNTTWTFSRDVDLKFEFVGVNYYDGQGFMVPASLGVSSALELDGATVCIQTGTTTELNLADFFASNNMSYEPVPIETNAEAQQQYLANACDVYTTDASGLAATRATFEDPSAHVVLPEIVSKEPRGPLVRHGDHEWGDIVRWSLNALIAAEEMGITSANVAELAAAPGNNPEINRILGTEGELGAMLGWKQTGRLM